jgi:hypothetical protein
MSPPPLAHLITFKYFDGNDAKCSEFRTFVNGIRIFVVILNINKLILDSPLQVVYISSYSTTNVGGF